MLRCPGCGLWGCRQKNAGLWHGKVFSCKFCGKCTLIKGSCSFGLGLSVKGPYSGKVGGLVCAELNKRVKIGGVLSDFCSFRYKKGFGG